MRFFLTKSATTLLLAAHIVAPAVAADAPSASATEQQQAMTLDTPLEQIVANAKGKAIIDQRVPGLTTHAMWDMFKAMSLNQLAPMAGDMLPESQLSLIAADLAALQKK